MTIRIVLRKNACEFDRKFYKVFLLNNFGRYKFILILGLAAILLLNGLVF